MQTIAPSPPPKFTLQQLQDYIVLTKQLTGNEVKEVVVSQRFINFYKEQIKDVVKNLNLPSTKNYKELIYFGVKLVTETDAS